MELPASYHRFQTPGRNVEMGKTNAPGKNPELAKLQEINRVVKSELQEKDFVNSRGLKVKLLSLPPYLIQMATASFEKPDPPTYTIQTAEGTEEVHSYDETSIVDPLTPDEDRKKWEDFQKELAEIEARSSEVLLNVILLEGVQLDFSSEIENSWVHRMGLMKISVPDDHDERLLMYKKMTVIGNTEDIQNITNEVMRLTVVSREEIDTIKDSFQDSVESGSSSESGKDS